MRAAAMPASVAFGAWRRAVRPRVGSRGARYVARAPLRSSPMKPRAGLPNEQPALELPPWCNCAGRPTNPSKARAAARQASRRSHVGLQLRNRFLIKRKHHAHRRGCIYIFNARTKRAPHIVLPNARVTPEQGRYSGGNGTFFRNNPPHPLELFM